MEGELSLIRQTRGRRSIPFRRQLLRATTDGHERKNRDTLTVAPPGIQTCTKQAPNTTKTTLGNLSASCMLYSQSNPQVPRIDRATPLLSACHDVHTRTALFLLLFLQQQKIEMWRDTKNFKISNTPSHVRGCKHVPVAELPVEAQEQLVVPALVLDYLCLWPRRLRRTKKTKPTRRGRGNDQVKKRKKKSNIRRVLYTWGRPISSSIEEYSIKKAFMIHTGHRLTHPVTKIDITPRLFRARNCACNVINEANVDPSGGKKSNRTEGEQILLTSPTFSASNKTTTTKKRCQHFVTYLSPVFEKQQDVKVTKISLLPNLACTV